MALPKLNTSKFLMTIPSTGQEVEYRPYLVKEEKILMMALETKDQAAIVRAVAQVIADCITEDIDIDKFAMYDVEYCFLQLRAKSSGEVIDLRLPCEIESCKHVNDFHVDISKASLQGWLLNISLNRTSITKKKRWFVLIDHYLLYFSSQVDSLNAYMKPLAIIPLLNCSILPFFKEENAAYQTTSA